MEASGASSANEDVKMMSSFKGPPMNPRVETGFDTSTFNATRTRKFRPPNQDLDQSTYSSIDALSEDFEHVLSSGRLLTGGTNASMEELKIEADRPEISIQIRNVEHALQSLSEGTVDSEVMDHLSELVPKIIRMERKVKTQSTLRGIFEEENQRLKNQNKDLERGHDQMREELRKMQEEVAELKKAKEDEQLGGFDFVTKKEASDMKHAEKKESENQQTGTTSGGVSEETHFNLQRKYASLKKQLEEIVKVNHSWEEHYGNMKAQLLARNDELQSQLTNLQHQEGRKTEHRGDHEKKQLAQKELAGALAEVVAVNQKFEKLESYAHTLKGQRHEMEKEIKRLNEALTQKMKGSFVQAALVLEDKQQQKQQQQQQQYQQAQSIGQHGSVVAPESPGSDKGVDIMSENEMKEEIELLRQQAEVFQSDFLNERHDRQRVMGELYAVQKDLRRTRKLLQKNDQEAQNMQQLEDVRVADQLRRQMINGRDQIYSASAPQPGYGYRIPTYQRSKYVRQAYPHAESGRLIAHGHGGNVIYNTAGNDVYVDGEGESDVGGVGQEGEDLLRPTPPPVRYPETTMICPRCERTFDNDPDFHRHISVCLD